MVSKEMEVTWYNGIFGNVTVQKDLKFVGSALEFRTVDAESEFEETVVVLRPPFLKKHYELRSVESFGRISRTLNVERVIDSKHPIFEICRAKDILGLYGAFCGE